MEIVNFTNINYNLFKFVACMVPKPTFKRKCLHNNKIVIIFKFYYNG